MTEVVLESTTVTETLEIVHSLKEQLTIHEDFSYKFIQGKYDWEMSEPSLVFVIPLTQQHFV